MKKFLLIVLTAVLAGGLLLTACSTETTVTATQTATATATATKTATATATVTAAPTKTAKAIHLSLFDGSPVGSLSYNQCDWLFKRLAELSGGQLIVDALWGTATSNQDQLDGLTKDTVDLAPLPCGYMSSVIKDVAIMGVPFCYYYKSNTDDKSLLEFNSLIKDTMVKIAEPYNVRFLSVFPPHEGGFYTVKKPIRTPADLNGVLLRTSGEWLGKLMTAWGASPTAILNTEAASALQKGIVEGAFTAGEPALNMGIPDNTPYVAILPYVDQIKVVWMSNASWKRLNAEQQGYLLQAIDEWLPVATKMNLDSLATIYDRMRKLGCEVYFMTKAEADAFKGSYYQGIQDQIRASNGPLGNHLCDLINEFNK